MLNFAPAGAEAVLSWPTSAVGFELFQSAELTTSNWLEVTNVPTVTNLLNQVTVPFTNRHGFYRLQYQ
jgi:hypothetical protein